MFILLQLVITSALALITQHTLSPKNQPLICNFPYEINRPINLTSLENSNWFEKKWFLNAQYDAMQVVPHYFNDSIIILRQWEMTSHQMLEISFHYETRMKPKPFFVITFETYIVNGTNGEFYSCYACFPVDPEKTHVRILEYHDDWMIISSCDEMQSILNVFLISKRPIQNTKDKQLAEDRMESFQERYEKLYPKDFYLFDLELPRFK